MEEAPKTKKKWPYISWFVSDWLGDPKVSLCEPATRGILFDWLCNMHALDRTGQITGTRELLARLGRCSVPHCEHALQDLKETNAAEITERNGVVTVTNRRMKREYLSRKTGSERVARWRGNDSVTRHLIPIPIPIPIPKEGERDTHARTLEREMPEVEVPSWAEVQAECQKIGLVEWRARDWFDEMEQSGWRDNKGREVMKWRPYLARVKSWWERDGRPLQPPVKAGDRAMTPMAIKTIIEAKKVKASELRAKYCSDTAIDAIWNEPQKRQEYLAIKKEIKSLNNKLSNMA